MATGIRILVIDDDPDFVASTAALLRSEGYEVEWARSGRDGLEALRKKRPDLVVLDVMMESVVEGYVVNQAIKFQPEFEAYADVPIVMVSSIDESPDERFPRAEELELVRPHRYLTKPLDVPLFLDVVRAATARRHATR
jgi:CheY-like chemotaxis protein